MIRTEKEYQATLAKIKQTEEAMAKQEASLKEMGLSQDNLNLAMLPMQNFYRQLKDEAESYKKVKNKDWDYIYQLAQLRQIGQLFIALRIAYGLTQKELAVLLGVSEAQVSKDERNEYHGISLERAMRIMEALNINPPHLDFRTDLDRDKLLYG